MANDGNHVPVTVQGSWNYPGVTAVIGSNYFGPPQQFNNGYWFLVVDLTSLKVVADISSTDTTTVPSGLSPYINNSQYLLIFVTQSLTTDHVPQGALYQFLQSVGASYQLARIEQINEQLGTGTFGAVGYILASTMAQDDGIGFEEASFNYIPILTFELMPVTVNGQTIYTPIKTGA